MVFLLPPFLYIVLLVVAGGLALRRQWRAACALAVVLVLALVPPVIELITWQPSTADEPLARRTSVVLVAILSMLAAELVVGLGALLVATRRFGRGNGAG